MNGESNGKKHLLHDDSSLKKMVMEAEKSVQEKKEILEETLPIKNITKKKNVFNDPEFLSTIEVNEEKKNPLQSLVIFLAAGILLTVVIIMAWRFNDSLGSSGDQKASGVITYDGRPLNAPEKPAGKQSVPVVPGGDSAAVMVPNKKPTVNQTVYNEPQGSEPQNNDNELFEQRKKLKVDTSVVPADFNLVRTESDGTHVYVDPKAEIYTLIPGEHKLNKVVRQHTQ